MLRDVLGFHQDMPKIDRNFRFRLAGCIGQQIPQRCFLAMDYHLDWVELALHLAERPDIQPRQAFRSPNPGDINTSQMDVDLLVAFEKEHADKIWTHLVLVEAKAYLPWSNRQLKKKVCRLRKIFGEQGTQCDSVKPHFVLMTGSKSEKIVAECWPNWMKKDKKKHVPFWLSYQLPTRFKVTRCDKDKKNSADGGFLRLN